MRTRSCWAALAVAACWAGCSFDPAGLASTDAFVDPGDDGGGVPRTWRDDTVEDFAADGAARIDAVVEPWGAIGPRTWLTGGLALRGSNDQLYDGLDDDIWAAIADATSSGVGVAATVSTRWGGDRPRGLGIPSSDTWTIWLDGEVWLEAGAHTLRLRADDFGVVELAPPGSTAFTRVAGAYYGDSQGVTGVYQAATEGWHAVRIALTEGVGDATLELFHQPPGGVEASLDPDRLRVASDAIDAGLYWTVFDDSWLLTPVTSLLFRDDAFDYQPNSGELTDLGLTASDQLSMRWTGQFRVDVPGAYGLRLDTDNGQRLWVDGELVLDYWTTQTEDHTASPITLTAGWHDLVVDLNEDAGNQRVRLTIDSGPELDSEAWPLARLRPVRPRAERTLGRVSTGGQIPDNGALTLELPLDATADARAAAVELGVTISHSLWKDLELAVLAPDGSTYVVLPADTSELTGTHTVTFTAPTPDEPVDGTWRLRVRDVEALDVGSVTRAAMTVRHRGGAPPVAARAIHESPVRELDVVGFDAVTWEGRFPAGTAAVVRLRTCDEAAACADAPWSEPVTTSGARPAVTGGRFAQYRVELTSAGDATPALDAIELSYRAAASR